MTAQPNSANADKQQLELAKTGREMLTLASKPPFELEADAASLEDTARTLVQVRDGNDAHLGFVLRQLKETARHVDRGFDRFNDYVEDVLQFSGAKANSLLQGWEDLETLGLPPTALSVVSWSKFRALGPAIRAGLIDSENIFSYLPKLVAEGEHALRVTDLADEVKMLTAKEVTDTAQEGEFKKVSFNVPAEQMEAFQENLQVVNKQFGESTTPIVDLVNYGASTTIDDSVDSKKVGGLVGLKRKAEALVPGVTVIFLTPVGDDYTEDELGIIPATHIYQDANDEIDGFVIATDAEDAKRTLGCEEVVQHRLFASTAYQPDQPQDLDIDDVMEVDYDTLPTDPKEQASMMKEIAGVLKGADDTVHERFLDFRGKLPTDIDRYEAFVRCIEWMEDEAEKLGVDLTPALA